ncbi:MAG: hemerythrin domain-containing protein [Pseudomonas sp.]|uniref:hemerythrin domain-containing protein n=1 Tax=Pseudomonas sp. TaxID=306 RepID=UPI00339670BF
MDVIDLLERDHVRIRSLLARLRGAGARALKTRVELLDRLALELAIHSCLEEELLYPLLCVQGGDEEVAGYLDDREEHRALNSLLLPDLQATDPSSSRFAGRLKVLQAMIEQLIEREQSELLPRAQKHLGKVRLQLLGRQMEHLRSSLKCGLLDMANQAA